MNQDLSTTIEKINVRTGYRKRLFIVWAWAIFFTSLVSIFIFMPVFYLSDVKNENIQDKISSESDAMMEQNKVLSLPNEINRRSKTILSFAKTSDDIYPKISKILEGAPAGILLKGISFKNNSLAGGKNSEIQISGVAKDRQSLIDFQKILEKEDFIKSVSVPVGSFVSEINLDFDATIILNF